MSEDKPVPKGLTRRDFLKGGAVVTASTALTAIGITVSEGTPAVISEIKGENVPLGSLVNYLSKKEDGDFESAIDTTINSLNTAQRDQKFKLPVHVTKFDVMFQNGKGILRLHVTPDGIDGDAANDPAYYKTNNPNSPHTTSDLAHDLISMKSGLARLLIDEYSDPKIFPVANLPTDKLPTNIKWDRPWSVTKTSTVMIDPPGSPYFNTTIDTLDFISSDADLQEYRFLIIRTKNFPGEDPSKEVNKVEVIEETDSHNDIKTQLNPDDVRKMIEVFGKIEAK